MAQREVKATTAGFVTILAMALTMVAERMTAKHSDQGETAANVHALSERLARVEENVRYVNEQVDESKRSIDLLVRKAVQDR